MRALVLRPDGEMSPKERRRRGTTAPDHINCDGLIEPHIEYNQEQGWRIVHRCRCGHESRSDGWHPELTAVEHIFWRSLRDDDHAL